MLSFCISRIFVVHIDVQKLSVTRACWRASEWGSARKSLNPRARRSEGIVGLRVPHVTPNLGSGDDWSEGALCGALATNSTHR
ncbi:jg5620 [Pararge aegeria aegeria]|uniref:Jg5620 protein n=1 Tax=Pararge aegeria aegeria TaxID=348720 RepID=A0A8S4QW20_9NEOP|nr:jg5620 [Pararge aegeria aegeria]